MPAPELFALGTETFGLSVCANAGRANVVNATARALVIRFMVFHLVQVKWVSKRLKPIIANVGGAAGLQVVAKLISTAAQPAAVPGVHRLVVMPRLDRLKAGPSLRLQQASALKKQTRRLITKALLRFGWSPHLA
jgi:hypothetical protein